MNSWCAAHGIGEVESSDNGTELTSMAILRWSPERPATAAERLHREFHLTAV
jgi:hypothetical protein